MKKSLAVLYLLLIILALSPIMTTEAQSTVTLKNWFGEGSYMDGYDFSAGVVQTASEDPNSIPLLSSDFYLGDSNFPVSTPAYYSPFPVINYGAAQLNEITQIPAKNDGRFATQAFAQGNTYGLFTREGEFVVLRVQSIGNNGQFGQAMSFSWQYVKQGQPSGVLSLTLAAPDKAEYALGDNVRIEGKLALDGKPVLKETDRGYSPFITLSVKDQSGKELFGVSTPSDKSGYYQFVFEYGSAIPTGFKGTLVVKASATHNSLQAEKTINVKYGSEPAKKALALELFGPKDPIQIGGFDSIGIAGKVTSQGANVDGALITMKVAGQTYQTTTGTHTSGSFNWYWNNDTFLAGNYTVEVTVTKDGYQTATGKVPFTVLGEGYDYQVVMDPIPPQLAPATSVSFPGKYYFAGKPHAGWLEIDVTFPNGRTNTYTELTQNDGRFTFKLPSMMETGFYTLKVFRHETRALISDTYTWRVGDEEPETSQPVTPSPPLTKTYEIVDVACPAEMTIDQAITISGKVISRQGEVLLPQEGWSVRVSPHGPVRGQDDQAIRETTTSIDGSFSIKITPSHNLSDTIWISASRWVVDYLDRSQQAVWFAPIAIANPLNPLLVVDSSDYDRGTVVSGSLKLRPTARFESWNDGLKVAYRIVGPIGEAEETYLFASPNPHDQGYGYNPMLIPGVGWFLAGEESFHWQIPGNAGAGMYEITAFVTGRFLPPTETSASFFVNDVVATKVTAAQQPSGDGWSSGDLVGQYSDFKGEPIAGGNLRVHFYTFLSYTGTGNDKISEFELSGTIEQDGTYRLNLEPLDHFAGQINLDPLDFFVGQLDYRPNTNKLGWVATVYAEKEGYATAATITHVHTPTGDAKLEIISINPETDFFTEIAEGGIDYKKLIDMDIIVRIRYNNFVNGAKINVGTLGHWAKYEPDPNPKKIFYTHLRVEDAELPAYLAEYPYWLNTWISEVYQKKFYYPNLSTFIPAKTGVAQESEFKVSGKVLLQFYNGLQKYSLYNPLRVPVVQIYAALGGSSASEKYYFTPPVVSPAEIEVLFETNKHSGLSFDGVVADGVSRLGMTIKVHGHQREGSLKVSSGPSLGSLEGNALAANGEITLNDKKASLTYVPPEYLEYKDLTGYIDKTELWYADVPIILTYTAKDGSQQDITVNIKVFNPPVFLVHGFTGDRDTWKELAIFLNTRKYYTFRGSYYAGDQSIPAQAKKLEDDIKYITKVKYLENNIKIAKVDLVVHSMGGLISRYYLGGAVRGTNVVDYYGGKPFQDIDIVRKLIMVATPNHGSTLFDMHLGQIAGWFLNKHQPAAKQLYQDSPFITNLNTNESSGLHLNSKVEYGNIYSYSDEKGFFSGDGVVSKASAHLNGVQSYVLENHTHTKGLPLISGYPSVTESTFVFAKVYEWLGKKIERAPLENLYVTIYKAEGDVKVQRWWWPDLVPVNMSSLSLGNLPLYTNETIITGPNSKASLDFRIQTGSSSENILWGSIDLDENTELQLGNLSPALSEIRLIKGSARFATYETDHNNHFSVDLVADSGKWQTVHGLHTDFVVTAGAETQIYSLEGDVLVEAESTDSEGNYALIGSNESLKINEIGSIDKISQPDSGWWENSFYNKSLLANIRTYLVILIDQGKTLLSLYRSGNLREMPIQDLSVFGPVVMATVIFMITVLVFLITIFFKRKILLILIPLLAGLIIGGWAIFNYSLHYNLAASGAEEGFESNLSLTIAEEGILPLQVAKRYLDYDQFSDFNTEEGVRVNLIVEGDNCDLESKPLIFDVLFELVSGNSDYPYHHQEKLILVDKMGLLIYELDPETGNPNAAADAIIPWGQISAGRSGLAEGPVTVPLDFIVSADVPYISGISKMRITVDPDQLYGEKVIREITGWYNYQTWSALFGELDEETTGLVYLIKGETNLEGEIWFEAVRLVEGSAAESGVGEYEVQMLTSGGDLLFSTSFNPDGQTGAINLSLPYQAGVAEIIVLKEGNIVAEFNRSANPPEIGFNTIPQFDEDSGTMEVYWEATDYDGDPLLYNLYAQYDQDHPLVLVASDLSVNNLSVNLNQLPGKQCLFMVTASDGFNTSQTFSELVITPPRGPAVSIMLDENITYDANQPVLLRATTTDAFNSNIPGENLIWYSDLDGHLGTGSVIFASLTKGTHEISLLASDLSGNMTIETVEIKVGELLAGMGSGLQGFGIIGAVLLLLFISLIVMFTLILAMRKKKKQFSQ